MNTIKNLALRLISVAVIAGLGTVLFLAVGDREGTASTDLAAMNVIAVSSVSGSTLYAQVDQGDASGVYRSTDGGRNWQIASQRLGRNVNALATNAEDPRIVYAGTSADAVSSVGNNLYISTDSGRNWENTPLALPMTTDARTPAVLSLVVDRSGAVYVGTDGQGIYKLTDRGTTMMALGDNLHGARVDQVLIGPEDQQQLYAVTSKGLFESTDAGEHWSEITTPPEHVVSLSVAPSDSRTMYAGTASMGAYRSTDGGNTWQSIGDGMGLTPGVPLTVRGLEVDANDASRVYAVPSYLLGTSEVHEAPLGVFVSNDGGDSWHKLSDTGATPHVNSLLPDPKQQGDVLLGTTQGIFSADQESISPASETGSSVGAAQAEDRADSASWDKVLIILATLAAVVVVIVTNPARIWRRSA